MFIKEFNLISPFSNLTFFSIFVMSIKTMISEFTPSNFFKISIYFPGFFFTHSVLMLMFTLLKILAKAILEETRLSFEVFSFGNLWIKVQNTRD